MTRKFNTKHPDRSMSHYPERLARRGLSRTPEMASLRTLQRRQDPNKKTQEDNVYTGWNLEESQREPHHRV